MRRVSSTGQRVTDGGSSVGKDVGRQRYLAALKGCKEIRGCRGVRDGETFNWASRTWSLHGSSEQSGRGAAATMLGTSTFRRDGFRGALSHWAVSSSTGSSGAHGSTESRRRSTMVRRRCRGMGHGLQPVNEVSSDVSSGDALLPRDWTANEVSSDGSWHYASLPTEWTIQTVYPFSIGGSYRSSCIGSLGRLA